MNDNKLSGFELDCAIVRVLKSGEMHGWFYVMRSSGKSNEEICKRHDEFKSDIEYLKKIHKFNKELRDKEIEELNLRKDRLKIELVNTFLFFSVIKMNESAFT
jgi:hypothetical protein